MYSEMKLLKKMKGKKYLDKREKEKDLIHLMIFYMAIMAKKNLIYLIKISKRKKKNYLISILKIEYALENVYLI